MTVLMVLFWSAVALVVYTYALFPALLLVRGRLLRRPFAAADHVPSASMIIVAHNEEASIGRKLDNLLALDYPRQQLKVIVASDGSTDQTNAIVAAYADRGIELLALDRQGKIPCLNAAVAQAKGDILLFSDANSMYEANAVRRLVRPFADPQVGGVAGDQRYQKKKRGEANSGERAYWNFDRMLKEAESAAGNTISATGAIYAIRRSLFQTVPPGVTDDFTASTAVIEQGYRLVFARDAVAWEPAAKESGVEFGRKVRVITRGFRSLIARRRLFNPLRHGFYSLQLLSHKLLRRLVFVPLVVLLVTSLLLGTSSKFFAVVFAVQAAFYMCAALGWLLGRSRLAASKLLAIPFYFCMVNFASLLALLNLVRGRRIDLWEPQRQPSNPPTVLLGMAVVTEEQR